MRHKVPHCSNCAEVMTTAPNVIPRSKATWESPKKKQKPFDDCHKPHSPSRLLPHREFALSVRARTRTPATVAPNYLLGESRAGHPHPIRMNGGVGSVKQHIL